MQNRRSPPAISGRHDGGRSLSSNTNGPRMPQNTFSSEKALRAHGNIQHTDQERSGRSKQHMDMIPKPCMCACQSWSSRCSKIGSFCTKQARCGKIGSFMYKAKPAVARSEASCTKQSDPGIIAQHDTRMISGPAPASAHGGRRRTECCGGTQAAGLGYACWDTHSARINSRCNAQRLLQPSEVFLLDVENRR
jgi:hypothetical protein